MQQTIYNFVINHLDEHGRFTETVLSDTNYETIPRPLGSEDAFYYSTSIESNIPVAMDLVELMQNYVNEPSQANRSALYEKLKGQVFAAYCDPFMSSYTAEAKNDAAYDLARRFFYNAQHREHVKFALLLFGIYGMKSIHDQDSELWQDIVKIAHCEEFTFPFLLACRISSFIPQHVIWELIRCTNAWGRVFAITDCQCQDEEQRLWLLENGTDISVEYPPLSIKFITETHLEEQLQKPLTYEQYKSAVVIVGNYLILLNHTPLKKIEESFNITSIDLPKLLKLILEQSQQHIHKPEDMLDMLSYAQALRSLIDENNLSQLSLNETQVLIASFENIIYSRDMTEEILANLIKDDEVNYTLCDLAVEMEIDIWQQLFDFWKKHPMEIELFPYLLSYEGSDRSKQVLKYISRHLLEYSIDSGSLLVPLRYLAIHPGEGEAIVCAALTSIYDLTRGIACGILDEWPPELITPAIRNALMEGRKLSNNDVVTARIDCLLQGKKFRIDKFMKMS
ncbi:hypothetical protein [Phascolarctobacterium succinatutens]|uniref:hypothetical protein n=1 Tax=Phascolarctobacterium succinatutens TaxID=626940 RepID=UPI0026EABAA3|nr:hypothetical protein [Phascolarctobacterium succinatutens]